MKNYKYKLLTKIKRIPIFDYEKRINFRKPFMTKEEMDELFADEILIEEKIDGKTEYIIVDDKILYFENLKYIHTIRYDMIPPPLRVSSKPFYILFDVYILSQKRWANRYEKEKIAFEHGYPVVPLIFKGKTKIEEVLKFLNLKSCFSKSEKIEGVVIKNYKKKMFGKIIGEEFFNALLSEDFEDYNKRPKVLNSIFKDYDYSKLFVEYKMEG